MEKQKPNADFPKGYQLWAVCATFEINKISLLFSVSKTKNYPHVNYSYCIKKVFALIPGKMY